MRNLTHELYKLYESEELVESSKIVQAAALLKAKAGGSAEAKIAFLKSKGYSDEDIMSALKMIKESVDDGNKDVGEKKKKYEIEEVEIGLDNAGKYKTYDTNRVLEDGDNVFKVEAGDEPVYFDSKEAAKKFIKEELDEGDKINVGEDALEPTEDDITTDDHNHWFWYGKLFHIGDTESLKAKLAKESPNFYPSLFFISDHGNAHLINEKIDWKKILASAAIIGALATVPVKGFAQDADVSDLFNFLGRVVNTVQTARGGNAGITDVLGAMQGNTGTYTNQGTYGNYGTHQANQGYAVWGGTSDAMVCTRANQADVGKYFKVVNTSDNTEVVVKCTNADSSLGRNTVISLSRGAFAQIDDLNHSSVYVTVQEVD